MIGKRVLIIGLARSGLAALDAAITLGCDISVQDSKKISDIDENLLKKLKDNNVKCFFGEVPNEKEPYDKIIISPGVDPELEFVQKEVAKGAELVGELELAYRLGSGNFIAITGTNGKTTTTSLVGEIFKISGRKTHVVGNIGVPVITEGMRSTEDDWLITETSSFQLQTMRDFKPMVSAILNVTPDHLNRHHTFENYALTKARIFENQTKNEYLVLNYDDKYCFSLGKNAKAKVVPFSTKEKLDFGAFLSGNMLVIRNELGETIELVNRNDLKIIGDHNVQNALAAAAICYFSGVSIEAIRSGMRTFGGVEHRIEFTRELNGVKYYNDSKGTNVDSVIIALNAIKKNIILIAGGDSKGQEFDELVKHFPGAVKKIVFLGRDAHFIQEACDKIGFKDYVFCKDMADCVLKAHELAKPGDTVLLSPACASWDMYPNFEVRGEDFKNCVRNLND